MWPEVVSALGTVLAALAAWGAWHQTHKARSSEKLREEFEHHLHPLTEQLKLTTQKFDLFIAGAPDTIEAAITRKNGPVLERLAVLEATTKDMKETWRQIALDIASVLHHPVPERRQVDVLLDAFKDGTLTSEEEIELRKYLSQIRDWKPGDDIGFPVYEGEQGFAALLLRIMGHAINPRHGRESK